MKRVSHQNVKIKRLGRKLKDRKNKRSRKCGKKEVEKEKIKYENWNVEKRRKNRNLFKRKDWKNKNKNKRENSKTDTNKEKIETRDIFFHDSLHGMWENCHTETDWPCLVGISKHLLMTAQEWGNGSLPPTLPRELTSMAKIGVEKKYS